MNLKSGDLELLDYEIAKLLFPQALTLWLKAHKRDRFRYAIDSAGSLWAVGHYVHDGMFLWDGTRWIVKHELVPYIDFLSERQTTNSK